MSSNKLDQIVKGAPAPGTSLTTLSPNPRDSVQSSSPIPVSAKPPSSPENKCCSPPEIYINLLVLEASLRSQYLSLRDRRRQNTFFIILLTIWVVGFTYALFFRPREDGMGIGGSVYWVVETLEKVALMGGVTTAILIWGTGQWDRGVRWPRRWLGVANRGLRTINTKLIIIKQPWWKEVLCSLVFIFPYTSLFPILEIPRAATTTNQSNAIMEVLPEEDLSPGGDCIKLLLLPKFFSPEFRESWETYRSEYWEKENERRARLREVARRYASDQATAQEGLFHQFFRRQPMNASGVAGYGQHKKLSAKQSQERIRQRRHSSSRTGPHSGNLSRTSVSGATEFGDFSGRSIACASAAGTTARRQRTRTSMPTRQESEAQTFPISRAA